MASNEQIADVLRNFYLRSHRVMDRIMTARGASFARTKALLHIAKDGPLRSTDLAFSLTYAPRTVTELIDGLERDGLVKREPDAEDRRAKRISLTPSGVAAAQAAEASRQQFVEIVFGTLSPSERDAIVQLMGKLNERLATLSDDEM